MSRFFLFFEIFPFFAVITFPSALTSWPTKSQNENCCTTTGRRELFDSLHPFLQGERSSVSYAEMAARLGTTEGTIKVTVNRMRRRYRELLRAVVAHTVASPAELDEELRHLVEALRG